MNVFHKICLGFVCYVCLMYLKLERKLSFICVLSTTRTSTLKDWARCVAIYNNENPVMLVSFQLTVFNLMLLFDAAFCFHRVYRFVVQGNIFISSVNYENICCGLEHSDQTSKHYLLVFQSCTECTLVRNKKVQCTIWY